MSKPTPELTDAQIKKMRANDDNVPLQPNDGEYPLISLQTLYGERISLRPSSAAMNKRAWLEINTAANKNDLTEGQRIEASAHISVRQAKILREALTRFIDSE